MNNFVRLIYHANRLNMCKIKYSSKTIAGIVKREPFEPKFNPMDGEDILDKISNSTDADIAELFPMGVYEYNCCADYAKKIMEALLRSFGAKEFYVEFGPKDLKKGIIVPPLEDCLERVANECDLDIVGEEYGFLSYTYTVQSRL